MGVERRYTEHPLSRVGSHGYPQSFIQFHTVLSVSNYIHSLAPVCYIGRTLCENLFLVRLKCLDFKRPTVRYVNAAVRYAKSGWRRFAHRIRSAGFRLVMIVRTYREGRHFPELLPR
jgi:hypothetical protein